MADARAASIVNCAARADAQAQRGPFETPEQEHRLDEAVRRLVEHGHHGLAQRVFLILERRHQHHEEAMRLLDDDQEHDPLLGEFRALLRGDVAEYLRAYDDLVVSETLPLLLLRVVEETAARFLEYEPEAEPYSNGGFGAVTASAAAVAGLEKRTFRAGENGIAECSICFEDFADGGEVSVMPCRRHEFHPSCIAKWLGISNMCPLCRHELPTSAI